MAQRLYAEQQQESQGADQANDSDNQGSNEENVVDADFEEVKEESDRFLSVPTSKRDYYDVLESQIFLKR